ncbi:MAG TPA: mannosyltransferase family protein, partial [Solirubrobacteraceae bacterium]|nr:mannosyltransferase family protein [Solirubrobacteraceae bacterium]
MTATVASPLRRLTDRDADQEPRAGAAPWRTPMLALVVSRLLVLVAGIAGAAAARVGDWSRFDPLHITSSFGDLGNVLAAASVRWDSIHYLAIAEHGYTTRANTAFFPLEPVLQRAVGVIAGSNVVAGVEISVGSLVVATVLLHRLTMLELGRPAADATVLLILFAPLSFFFSALYTESLFLALSVGAVYAARRERLRLACVLGALAAVTRVTGILIVAPIVLFELRRGRRLRVRMAWILIVPAVFMAYLGYLASRGYGLLAPFQQQTSSTHGHTLGGPIQMVFQAVGAAASGIGRLVTGAEHIYSPSAGGPLSPAAESVWLFIILGVAVAALVYGFKRLPLPYTVYAALSLLICISSPVAGQPLKSLDRYVLVIFPLWMAA